MSLFFESSQVHEVYTGSTPVNQIIYKNRVVWSRRITLTIVPNPSNATVVLTAPGETQSGNSITVFWGTTISYTVSRAGYVTATGTYRPIDNESYPVNLTQQLTFTLNPDPSDATVVLTSDSGTTQTGNSILVNPGGTVTYSVSKSAYVSQSGSQTVNSNTTLSKSLSVALPVNLTPPSSSNKTLVASTSGANNTIYTVPSDGWYYVELMGGGSRTSGDGVGGTAGGLTNRTIYLHKGAKCLLWSGNSHNGNTTTGASTGYPSPSDYWGGTGATGHSEGGGGGGGAANNGRNSSHWDGGPGAAGSGFLAGVDRGAQSKTFTNGNWSRNFSSDSSFSVGSFSVSHLYIALLAGGAGGACGKNDDVRTTGGGGGAYGNGAGTTYSTVVAETAGPGGAWGVGTKGNRYGSPGVGAWAVLDLTTNTCTWGQGGGAAYTHGYCKLYKINT